MTNDNKKNILDYITNKIIPTSKNDSEIFLEQDDIARSNWVNYLPSGWNDFRYEGMVAGNETTSNLSVLYGGYLDTNNVSHGIITLVDSNFKPVKTIYEYSSGTELRYIQYMKQAEDGTFYFIDDTAFSYSNGQQVLTSQKRFVMTNNFTIKDTITNDYQVNLRTSYILGDSYKNFYCKNMYKDTESANYIFFGVGADSNSSSYSYGILKIIGLSVNVGESNTWTLYSSENSTLFGSAIATFDTNDSETKVKFRCLCSSTKTDSKSIFYIYKEYNGNVNKENILTYEYHPYIDDDTYKKQSVFLDYDNVYFVINNQRWGTTGDQVPKYICLYKYNFATHIGEEIYKKYLGDYDRCNLAAMYIDRCNTNIYVQYNDNINSNTADYYFQRLVDDKWQPIFIKNDKFVYDQRIIFVKSNYNLLQVNMYATNPRTSTWYQHVIKEDYNSLNYNGTPYIDYDSMISRKGQIYSNDKIVFARNLYNKTINGSTTTSTIQVPNNYLNDITLNAKKLLSNTNAEIDIDTKAITKNVYEVLFINFIDTIGVIDEDTDTYYNDTANYINTNINTGTKANLENTFVGKVRINYSTPQIQLLNWVWNTDHYETEFVISTYEETPTSIDFISNDETMLYMSKNVELEEDKYYKISQKLRIE